MEYYKKAGRRLFREYASLDAQAFGVSIEDCLRQTPQQAVRLLLQDKQVVAGLTLHQGGQWLGGQRLASGLIAGVAVRPDQRGSGAGRLLMQEMLQELHAAGTPLSALYASTSAFYRKLGYALAGDYSRWEVPSAALPAASGRRQSAAVGATATAGTSGTTTIAGAAGAAGTASSIVQCDPANPQTRSAVIACYQEYAARYNGMLDRPEEFWDRILIPHQQQVHLYIACSDPNDPCRTCRGYAVLNHTRQNGRIELRDAAAGDHDAADALLDLLAGHRSVADHINWPGPAGSPLLLRIPDHARIQRTGSERWLLRICNAAAALEQRGYPPVSIQLQLHVNDTVIPANSGEYLLTLHDGTPEVHTARSSDEPARHPRPRITTSAEGLAALLAGIPAAQLAAAGLLQGTSGGLAAAESIFHGGAAAIQDKF
ncbi:GNAT family N-acetyltransferase [Spirochaeta africana]|uniref:Putative acetyltransferase n=1 Tax=Spirochaeta africana (strain ATCC 700263 / DSM 8902 / Z-7692) TaxID=889378 RepID=H9ULL8_SPIAZ|nr:GNAT family N-acetyltransferase [Spirochaeta africana]AFG38411.1 putative acetyltransferase [Spirochaeta africana DSM 8902]